jgi:hypothetical protein
LNSIRLLMHSVLDYAGLFPPASLGMAESVQNFTSYRRGEWAWALGRFILPVSMLGKFEGCVAEIGDSDSWHLSVLGGTDPDNDLAGIIEYSRRSRSNPHIDAIEWKVRSADEMGRALSACRSKLSDDGIQIYFEISLGPETTDLIAAAATRQARVKVRTGGVTPDLFPPTAALAEFILSCAQSRLPFKATAGLHHPFRAAYPLTYDPGSPSGVMHGFLNVLAAAAFAHAGGGVGMLEAILEESAEAFTFDGGIGWRGKWLGGRQLSEMRERLFVSFGACSFEEPISELKALRML